jgi:hypothetical protein
MNAWSYTSTPPTRLHGVVLSLKEKHRNSFTFYHPYLEAVSSIRIST